MHFAAEFHFDELFKHGASYEGHADKYSLTIRKDVLGGAQERMIREC